MNIETLELVEFITQWHGDSVDSLNLVLQKRDANIKIDEMEVEAGTPLHTGILVGVKIALMQLGELPFTLTEN